MGWVNDARKEFAEGQLLIGNNLGKINGWVSASAAIGRVVAVVN